MPAAPSEAQAQRAADLRDELRRHNQLYYAGEPTEISDPAFDELLRELRDLETEFPELQTADSPTQRVGGTAIDGFVTVPHAVPMLSIDNTYSREEFETWHSRILGEIERASDLWTKVKPHDRDPIQLILEPKIDGVALSLRYENGTLVQALTRGDGAKGDDITHNIKTVHAIPLKLNGNQKNVPGVPEVLEVRGEIYMPHAVFEQVNAKREAAGEDLFANPRNSTAGTLKQKDPAKVIRGLAFIAHGRGVVSDDADDAFGSTHSRFLEAVGQLGVPTHEHQLVGETVEQAWGFIES
ncbi:MAG: NAD-dependent DNA ligase LigA, partial [Planctomycetota bacterium]